MQITSNPVVVDYLILNICRIQRNNLKINCLFILHKVQTQFVSPVYSWLPCIRSATSLRHDVTSQKSAQSTTNTLKVRTGESKCCGPMNQICTAQRVALCLHLGEFRLSTCYTKYHSMHKYHRIHSIACARVERI